MSEPKLDQRKIELLEFGATILNGIRATRNILKTEGETKGASAKQERAPDIVKWYEGYEAAMADAVKAIDSFLEDYS